MFLLLEFFCGTPPSCFKVKGWCHHPVVAYSILMSSLLPLGLCNWVFELIWTWLGLGLRVWGEGLTINTQLLSSPGPKPLAPKTKNQKPRGQGLTLKSYGPPTPPYSRLGHAYSRLSQSPYSRLGQSPYSWLGHAYSRLG